MGNTFPGCYGTTIKRTFSFYFDFYWRVRCQDNTVSDDTGENWVRSKNETHTAFSSCILSLRHQGNQLNVFPIYTPEVSYEDDRTFTKIYKANFTLNSFIIWRGRCNFNIQKKKSTEAVFGLRKKKRYVSLTICSHHVTEPTFLPIKCACVALWRVTQKATLRFSPCSGDTWGEYQWPEKSKKWTWKPLLT